MATTSTTPPVAVTPPNEIWPGGGPFVANGGGIANGQAVGELHCRCASAVSVVVHDLSLPSTANKVACADLA